MLENNLKFYNNLSYCIRGKKLSSRQFCKDLGYSKDNLVRWKNGIQPTLQRLLEMTEYFDCTIDDLIK